MTFYENINSISIRNWPQSIKATREQESEFDLYWEMKENELPWSVKKEVPCTWEISEESKEESSKDIIQLNPNNPNLPNVIPTQPPERGGSEARSFAPSQPDYKELKAPYGAKLPAYDKNGSALNAPSKSELFDLRQFFKRKFDYEMSKKQEDFYWKFLHEQDMICMACADGCNYCGDECRCICWGAYMEFCEAYDPGMLIHEMIFEYQRFLAMEDDAFSVASGKNRIRRNVFIEEENEENEKKSAREKEGRAERARNKCNQGAEFSFRW